jgi:hypothetical protein
METGSRSALLSLLKPNHPSITVGIRPGKNPSDSVQFISSIIDSFCSTRGVHWILIQNDTMITNAMMALYVKKLRIVTKDALIEREKDTGSDHEFVKHPLVPTRSPVHHSVSTEACR